MRISATRCGLALWLPVVALTCGCDVSARFKITTAVHADGSCDRTTIQPREGYLPSEARPSKAPVDSKELAPDWIAQWTSVIGAKCPPEQSPPDAPLYGSPYFNAEGTFASPEEIPLHYRYFNRDQPEAGASTLVREFSRTDFGPLVEYRWSESITNNLTRARLEAAVNAALDKLIPLMIRQSRLALGEDYDTSGLEAFLLHDARALVIQLADCYYDLSLTRTPDDEAAERMIALLEKQGWKWGSKADDPFQTLAIDVLAHYLRHADGGRLTKEEATAALNAINDQFDKNKVESEALITDLYEQPLGAYPIISIFRAREEFDFTLALPGNLVETNGLILAANRCGWRFNADDTFPLGYQMTARSIAIDAEAQRALLDRVAIDDIPQASEFIKTVGRKGRLFEAVQQAFADKSLDPIRSFEAKSSDEQESLNRLKALLLPSH